MRSWFFFLKMIFDFLKRIFGLVDEGTRKRHADELDNDYTTNIVSPKKHCCDRDGVRVGRQTYADENDEEEIQFLSDTNYHAASLKKRLNGISYPKKRTSSSFKQPVQTYSKNPVSKMNGKDTRTNRFSVKGMAAMSSSDCKYSTLTKTNQLREKHEYSQLLQSFLPQRVQAMRNKSQDDESKKRQVAEVIDLEKSETPKKSVGGRESQRQSQEVFSTPLTSTPLKWYTPKDTRNHEPVRSRTKDDEVSVLSVRRASNARPKNDEISILKARTQNDKNISSIPRIIPIVRVSLADDVSVILPTKKPTIEKTGPSTSRIIPIIGVNRTDDVSIISPTRKSMIEKSEPSTSRIEPRNQIEVIATNTLRDNFAAKAVMKQDFIPRISGHYKERQEQRMKEAEELKRMTCLLAKHNQLAREAALETQLARSMRLCEAVLDETEELEEAALPELTPSMLKEIQKALIPHPPNEILVESFGLRITRKDVHTLSGLNWLNDEVINFYMNLLIIRGTNNDKYPKVHAMNTFFYPKLLSGGHASLKRWTRKIDVFTQDILVVPIHLGIHWCMSIVDFRDKTIRYYDSMGGSNPKCLGTLRQYLEDECMDKKKRSFDTNDWKLVSMKNIPQQMNGSDCGVFSCMFAEFITANRKITFTQQDMPYFRSKMVYEILKAKLL